MKDYDKAKKILKIIFFISLLTGPFAIVIGIICGPIEDSIERKEAIENNPPHGYCEFCDKKVGNDKLKARVTTHFITRGWCQADYKQVMWLCDECYHRKRNNH